MAKPVTITINDQDYTEDQLTDEQRFSSTMWQTWTARSVRRASTSTSFKWAVMPS